MFLFIIADPNEAAEILTKLYRNMMVNLAESILKDYHAAEDIAQESMLSLLSNLHLIDAYDSVRTKNLVFTVVKNAADNELKKRWRKFRHVVSADNDQYLPMREPQIDFKAFEDKYGFSEEVQELLSCLNEIDYDIIRLKFGSGYQDQEIAQILGLTLPNVKKRYQRSKAKLIELQQEKEVQKDEL